MSVLENLLGTAGAGLLQAALGVYCLVFGLGVIGKPRPKDGVAQPAPKRPLMVVAGVALIGYGIFVAARGAGH